MDHLGDRTFYHFESLENSFLTKHRVEAMATRSRLEAFATIGRGKLLIPATKADGTATPETPGAVQAAATGGLGDVLGA